jgi:hypothetical protein
MAKICIHIPDDILAKVKRHKDRMNISKVCSAALLKEVEVISNIPQMVDETKNLIERLRQGMHAEHSESFNIGVKLAQAYLSKISYERLRAWGTFIPESKRPLVLPEEVEDYLERCSMEKKLRHPIHRPSFAKGWHVVMKRTWETVKDKV